MAVTCNICKNGNLERYGEWSAIVFDIVYTLSQCNHCGTVMSDPIPDEATLQRFYSECYDFRWFRDHIWAKMRDARLRVQEYRQFLGRRVLDFGGGLGYFSRAAREKGYESVTFDPYLNDHKIEVGVWDSVVSLHALEHVSDPVKMLGVIRNCLKQGGNVILAVPNFLSRGYQELGMSWVWAQPPIAHIYHFTPRGISALLEQSGFELEIISFCERWDANLYTDLKCRDKYILRDLEWAVSPYSKYRIFQKYVAIRNSLLRFEGLKNAKDKNTNSDDSLSEMYLIAKRTND